MGLVNWEPEPSGELEPGIYLGEIAQCELRRSRGGSPYFNVRFVTPDPFTAKDVTLCFDVLMLDGKGRSIGQGKLGVLGFDKDNSPESPQDLVGRRAWLACVEEEYRGRSKLAVDLRAEGSNCGYWPEDSPPPGLEATGIASLTEELKDDMPF